MIDTSDELETNSDLHPQKRPSIIVLMPTCIRYAYYKKAGLMYAYQEEIGAVLAVVGTWWGAIQNQLFHCYPQSKIQGA